MTMVVDNCVDIVTNVVVYDCYVLRLFARILTIVWSFITVVRCIIGVTKFCLIFCCLFSIRTAKSILMFIRLPTIIF